MICLSKADEAAIRHLSYNQSPRALAPESTTCQDLNGISNLRELVASDQDDDDSGGGATHGSADGDDKWQHLQACTDDVAVGRLDAGRWPASCAGLSSRPVAVVGGEGRRYCPSEGSPIASTLSRAWDWTIWIVSVISVAYVLNCFTTHDSSPALHQHHDAAIAPLKVRREEPKEEPKVLGKRDSCASGGANANEYNTGLHVGALMIIWFVSSLAAAFPIAAKKLPGLKIPARFFFAVRHFGTGVLIATAFVHLLPTAFISLGNPCLGDFWVNDYPAMPGAIALASIFLVTVLEMIFHPARHGPEPRACSVPAVAVTEPDGNEGGEAQRTEAPENDKRLVVPFGPKDGRRGRANSVGSGLNRLHTTEQDNNAPAAGERDAELARKEADDESITEETTLTPEQKIRKERLQCVLLELGILFHSVFIGMALSVSVGNEFIVLLIAIAFHQTFEGLALGSRIATISWGDKTKQPWIMAAVYGLTTPLGQALGIATHTLYSPDSKEGLIVVGVMNSISAGLLTFASLVELMSEDFLSDESWKHLRGKKRVIACVLVFMGAFGMSLVGAWA